jgi:hypothetical protein
MDDQLYLYIDVPYFGDFTERIWFVKSVYSYDFLFTYEITILFLYVCVFM